MTFKTKLLLIDHFSVYPFVLRLQPMCHAITLRKNVSIIQIFRGIIFESFYFYRSIEFQIAYRIIKFFNNFCLVYLTVNPSFFYHSDVEQFRRNIQYSINVTNRSNEIITIKTEKDQK